MQALCKMLQYMKDGNAFIGGGKQAKKTSNTRKDLLNIFRTRFLPEKPSAELLFEVYRLLIPKARPAPPCAAARDAAGALVAACD